ncbi:1-(5-phosphoribosyl)-5-amino-4-imidazole- carboxylate (AIR) carboxylase [Isosphaera pallida ATCC 43644]|uniref:1-(5-phosphoribosyl)-5-amino-4-imidazole-carboxylate (AIR) carboxylase n=1 Tax=Isosphaera pallida (strain ATCC 43644 / DSM 9630 / IS1B) TaxID=575540 RepID=E8QX12_ISOPI|nr:nickel pincer cofactor biosynthesis protein LarB [Isosphaera pallida]ADV64051.1 1-(5-phosphoribosyl)-5-amino-4-imidazole- carboxylate (AIR) carboxylase [Isosphaera pallida ATCC 43644]
MNPDALARLLDEVRRGAIEPSEAAQRLIRGSEDRPAAVQLGDFATLDLNRKARCGFPEVVFGQGKTPDQIRAIMRRLGETGQGALVTRITAETGELLQRDHPEGQHNPLGRTFRIPPCQPEPVGGNVVVVTAGTADLPVAEEARVVAEAWACEVKLIADVGVAGLHRLLRRLPEIVGADAVVAVAGMEAALPSVLGGLVDCPVVAVPTSVGYGAHFHGLTSLLAILNSCASNVTAVNIDAGFNGGHLAGMIARKLHLARQGHAHAPPSPRST